MADPVTDEDEAYKAMACAFGDMSLTWADAENALGMAIAAIDREFGPVGGRNELPRSLKGRINYVKTALRGEARLKAFEERGMTLVAEFGTLKHLRHHLTHGITRHTEAGIFISFNFDTVGRNRIAKRENISLVGLIEFGAKVRMLRNNAMIFAALVGDIAP